MKYAVLIGINYSSIVESALSGCINDIIVMYHILTTKLGYEPINITLMADKPIPLENNDLILGIIPTKENILIELINLAKKANDDPYAEIWVHYSGHGIQVPDVSGDESDNMDEAIIPIDFKINGYISDDDIHDMFASKLAAHVRCVCIMDCCHSGTLLDLRYKFHNGSLINENLRDSSQAKIITISGCKDTQTSAEKYIYREESTGRNICQGAMTAALAETIGIPEEIECIAFIQLLQEKLKHAGFSQIPRLCSSQTLDNMKYIFSKNGECHLCTI